MNKAAHPHSGLPAASRTTFTDSGSANISVRGVCVLEVQDDTSNVIGGCLAVGGTGWAAILASASAPAGLSPTFAVVGGAIQVSTSGGTGRTVSVVTRGSLAARGSEVSVY